MKVVFRNTHKMVGDFAFPTPMTITGILENSRILIWMTAQNFEFQEVLSFNNSEAVLLVKSTILAMDDAVIEQTEAHSLG